MSIQSSSTQTDETPNECAWMHSIKVTLGSLDHRDVQSFISSIPSVPSKLRKSNDEAYSPKLITIGPIHRASKSHLLVMEEHKWRYMLSLLHRTQNPDPSLDECGTIILGFDDAVRASYGGNIRYDPYELAKIMLLDGCFLLELLLRSSPELLKSFLNDDASHQHASDPIVQNQEFSISDPIVQNQEFSISDLTDLILLENQIPFFVIKTLARILFPKLFRRDVDHRVPHLVLSLFGYPLIRCSNVAHFLHLLHLSSIIDEESSIIDEEQKVKQAHQGLRRCATRLGAFGVTINTSPPAHCKKLPRFDSEIIFSKANCKGELKIPPLHIVNTTEIYLRNFIAWEHSRIGINRPFTSYALFFKGLIYSLQDIDLLVEKNVIVNEANISNKGLLELFGTITSGVDQRDSSYSQFCHGLNSYSDVNPLRKFPIMMWHCCRLCVEFIKFFCKRSYGILIRDHIPNVWKLIGVMAAALLLALTITQTYYSAK